MENRPNHPVRSWLFTPGTRPDRLLSAANSKTDVSILDLEDSVPPAEKGNARNNVRALLNGPEDSTLPTLAVRINATTSRYGLDDLAALLDTARSPRFILIPKVESAEQVRQVAEFIKEAGRDCTLVPLIESGKGLEDVESIARASSAIAALMFGAADYASDVRAQPSSLALQIARVRIANACAIARISSIDSPCFAIHDVDLLQNDLKFASENGYQGKAAIHPSHINAINKAFTPSEDRITWAKRVLEANEQGAGVVDGRMVDEAIAREARQVLTSI